MCSDKKRGSGVFPARPADIQATVQYAGIKQDSNCSAQKIRSRIEFSEDLHAVCSINFRKGNNHQ